MALSQPLNSIFVPLPHPSEQQSKRTKSPTNASRISTLIDRRLTEDSLSSPLSATLSRRHASSASVSSFSSGIFSLAAAALDRTQSAIASISEPVVRHRSVHSQSQSQSFTALPRLSFAPLSPLSSDSPVFLSRVSTHSLSFNLGDGRLSRSASLSSHSSPTQSPSELSSDSAAAENIMHQTSSRLLRMTDDDRPFTRDFKDLFSTLIVSLLPLSAHRVRLTKVEYTFLSEDAINNLGSLKFSQSNRMPDPKDPSRIVTTTTTTTFSMAKDMARSICQRFVEARFIESADGKMQQAYNMKGAVWQLTPKGIAILDRFCSKNGIQQRQVTELAGAHCTQLVLLERDQGTDKLLNDRGTVEVIFRRFAGSETRNVKATVAAADSDSLHDYKDGLTGVKMAAERRIGGKTYFHTFTGKAASDWLMDCATIVDRREAVEIATLFVEHEFIEPIVQDKPFMTQHPGCHLFQPSKNAIYQLTQRGKDIISGNGPRGRASESETGTNSHPNGVVRDSNTARLEKILHDPALRLLFRENLRDTHCEENLSFYKDVHEFVHSCKIAIRLAESSPSPASMDAVKEIMAQAYGIYNAFLAPGSPCELNIDHQLRNNLATRMTKAVGQENGMIETLQEVTSLFEDAQNAVFKLMASDSVPKFLRNAKYEHQLRNFDSEGSLRGVERSQSRSTRK